MRPMKKLTKTCSYEFDESKVTPSIEYSDRHEIIEGKNGVDDTVNQFKKKSNKDGKKLSAQELDELWWKTYKKFLVMKGYKIQE